MSQTRHRPRLGTPYGPDTRPDRGPKLGLIFIVFCAILSLEERPFILCSTTPSYGLTSDQDNSTAYESNTTTDDTTWHNSTTGGTAWNNSTTGGTTWNNSTTGGTTWNNSTTGGTTWNNSTTGGTAWNNSTTGGTTWNNSTTGATTWNNSTTGATTRQNSTTATTPAPVPAISETICASGDDCDAIFGPEVVCGPVGFCACASADYVPVGDQCRHKCVTEARKLHDKDRRTKNYKNVKGEPVVTDHKITEGWYSLDKYRLMMAGTGNLTGGLCGTRYQIVIKDGSTVDWDSLDLNEVTLTATVHGRPEGKGEDLEIRVRKCESAFQYYLTPPTVRLAAYCFDSLETSPIADEDPFTYPSSTYLNIESSLNFREELRQGQWFDVPYVIWTCKMRGNIPEIFSEIQFVTITWFADNTVIQSTEPQPITNDEWHTFAAANLTEDDLMDAGFSLGVVIRCGAQVSRSATGKLSNMLTSSVDTNLQAYASIDGTSGNIDKLILHVNFGVSLGCVALVGSEGKNCSLKLSIIRDDHTLVCSDGLTDTDQHGLCGLTLFGKTKNGEFPIRRYTNANGTSVYEQEYVYIQLDSTIEELERNAALYVSLAVTNNTAGHALWDNYNIHNAKINLPEHWSGDQGEYHLRIYQSSGNNISYPIAEMYGWHPSSPIHESGGHLPIDEAGKYIVLWSGRFPFTFEVEIASTVDGNVYMCGAYLRYGNDIYAYSYCGGVFIEGLIFGDGYYIPETILGYITLREVGLSMSSYISEGYMSISFNSIAGFELDFLEGFSSFSDRGMIGRQGNVYKNDTAEFLRSWRIDDSESLSNPENHIFYSLESKYSTCVCPAKTDDIPEREQTSNNHYNIHYNVYIGALRCNLDEICTDVTVGEDWPTSLRPDYMIKEVKVGCEQRFDMTGEPFLAFTCQFDTVPDKFYTVKWYINNVMFRRVDTVSPEADLFLLTDDEIFGTGFTFDMKIMCSVSVLDGNENELIAPITSDVFEPIHFQSTDIIIQRGGDGTITWANNIPFICNGGYTDCDMELQFFDLNDTYACEDSTVAIKADDDCGGRVTATNTISAATGTDSVTTITTKNNDKYELKTEFELRVMVIFHGAGKSTWTHLLKIVFFVRVIDEMFWIGASCHLHVDPHAKLTDGVYYEMQLIGHFVLLKHLYLPMQIQVITLPCWEHSWGDWPTPTCICAIIFQAGRDVFLINHCNGEHHTGFLPQEPVDYVLEVNEMTDTRYQIIFPSTMKADVYVMPYFNYFMNVDLYPSPGEKHNIAGLCGNFNGDTGDDFKIRDTANKGSDEEFSLSWELHETGKLEAESLLEEANYQNPTPWNSQQKLCVCPNAHDAVNTQSSPLCSANEEKTCTKPKSHKGKKLNHGRRLKRETDGYVNLDTENRVRRLKRNIFEQHAIHRKKRGTVSGASRMNETDAQRVCVKKFSESAISNVTGKLISEDQYIKDCVFDLKASGNEEWAGPQITLLTTRNEEAIQRNVTFAQSNPEVVAAMEEICTHGCNGHGTCNGSDTCICESGWGRKSCLLDLSVGPKISYITGGGICDLATDECLDFIIETDGLEEQFRAKVTVFEANTDGIFTKKNEFVIEVAALTLNEGVIDVTTQRRRRSTSSDPVLANQYGVSVSNDGVNFGNASYVTVLDTRCQETTNNSNGDTIVVLMAGNCFIDGVCYGEGNSSAASNCHICRTATSLFDWTEENCPTTTTPDPSQDESLPLYVIIFSVTGGMVVVIAIAGLIFLIKHTHKKRPVTPLPAPPPYPGPAPVGPMNLRFYLKEVDGQTLKPDQGPKWRY